MISNLKPLFVVIVLALAVFQLAKPISLMFSNEADFKRRRNVWFLLTIVAFLSPSFWLYAAVAVPTFIWSTKRDRNPIALFFLLMQVIPAISVNLPAFGIDKLFEVNNYRLLSLFVLLPTLIGLRQSQKVGSGNGKLDAMDLVLLGYGALLTITFVPPDLPDHTILKDSVTNLLRRGFLFFLDTYLVFFVTSRFLQTRQLLVECLAVICLSNVLLATFAVFETAKSWLLYVQITSIWTNDPRAVFYLLRGGALRAQASAGHAIVLGYLLAIAFGIALYLNSKIKSRAYRLGIPVLLWSGLMAAYSRGPWMGAASIYIVFTASRPKAWSRLLKAFLILTIGGFALSITPLGERIINVLPFMGGSIDSGNVAYRHRLAERTWELMWANPIFGDPRAYEKMEDLRQGEGIIDLVNTYANFVLFYGLAGLLLFLGFIFVGIVKTYSMACRARTDPDIALIGFCLLACMSGILLMIESSSFLGAIALMYFALAGIMSAYSRLPVQPLSYS
jgi:hypothetical protein